jgi:hypothetical protein
MTEAIGPIFAAGFQTVTKAGYPLLFLPDANNDALQREGKPPVYHWLPNSVRLAKKDNGDFKFSFLQFVGVQNEDTHVGVEGTQEVAGALCGFSTTSSPPPEVLQEASDELINRFRGSDDYYWGWRSPATPMIRPAPIVSNTMSITSLSPNGDGSMPSVASGGGGAPAPAGGGGAPAGPGGPPNRSINAAPQLREVTRPPLLTEMPRTVSLERAMRASNLDAWYANLAGSGPGSVTPFAENAFSGLLGSYPAAMVYSSFHGGQSAITVWQILQLKVWSPICEIRIRGDWSRIQDHFSGHAHGGGWFWSADIKAEFNSMRQSGMIESEILVDSTLPNAEKIQEMMEKRSDLVFQKFLDQANKTIFEPAPFQEKAAEASGGFLGLGGGVAVKLRRDRVSLRLEFHEKRQMAYLQPNPISGQLEGMYDHIKADPDAEKRYFQKVFLDDWNRSVTRVFKPVVNWPDRAQKWVGQPVAFLSAQVGYPDTEGNLQWTGHIFQANDKPDENWRVKMTMKKKDEVENPPAGWEPDKTFIKRQVHFGEPPNETENPFVRVQIEKNVVDLDPGESGVPLNTVNNEIRVDNVGGINAGPMFLGVDLENDKQIVEITFQPEGKTKEGKERPPVKFTWKFGDQIEPRYWMLFTGDPDYLPKYKYQVRVLVKGSIFTKGQEWTGPWQDASGNGPIMLSVPTPQDEGVVTRELKIPMIGSKSKPAAIGAGAPPSSGNGSHTPVNGEGSRPPVSAGHGTTPPSRPPVPLSRPSAPPPRAVTAKAKTVGGYSIAADAKAKAKTAAAKAGKPPAGSNVSREVQARKAARQRKAAAEMFAGVPSEAEAAAQERALQLGDSVS